MHVHFSPPPATAPNTNFAFDSIDKNYKDFSFISKLQDCLKNLSLKGFNNTGSIHSEWSIRFYDEVLGADHFVLDLLKNGLSLPFKNKFQHIRRYRENNNKSCKGHESYLRQKLWSGKNRERLVR